MKRNRDQLLTSNLLRGNSTLLVLSILRDAPTAGFEIAAEIQRRSNQLIDFKQGTLYPLLHEMERKGLIESDWHLPKQGRPHRVYRPTETGLHELEHGLRAWVDFATAMTLVTGAKPEEQGA